ncbi:MAG: hypothetical protein R3195_12570 [Gemmatimonadota bacterium]|nr:hypothetical protein [Gemmatimonadota bacterium]
MITQLVRKRLGCAGWQADRVLRRVHGLVPELRTGETLPVGLGDPAIEALYVEAELDELARRFHVERGLRQGLWWGSALADVACSAVGEATDDTVLREGALLHLGLNLYDAVVDIIRRGTRTLSESLDPARLAARLARPEEASTALTCPDEDLQRIVRLFDSAMVSVGRRWAEYPDRAGVLVDLYRRMYESELRISADPFEAKELPYVFVGALVIPPGAQRARSLIRGLSRFFALGDDWDDMFEDMIRGAPNAFLSNASRSKTRRALGYAGRSALRLAAGRRMHDALAERLAAPLRETLQVAREIGPGCHARTLSLCRATINER